MFVVLFAVHALEAGGAPLRSAFRATALALPFAALFPLGGALATDRSATAWWAVAVAAFAAVPLALIDLGNPPAGLGAGLLTVFLFVGAVFAPVVGVLVLLLGQALAADATGRGDAAARRGRERARS